MIAFPLQVLQVKNMELQKCMIILELDVVMNRESKFRAER
jgi:hypothetical protein